MGWVYAAKFYAERGLPLRAESEKLKDQMAQVHRQLAMKAINSPSYLRHNDYEASPDIENTQLKAIRLGVRSHINVLPDARGSLRMRLNQVGAMGIAGRLESYELAAIACVVPQCLEAGRSPSECFAVLES